MKIFWTGPAVADLDDIYTFIARENAEAAQRVVVEIYRSVETNLREHPGIGRAGRVEGTREYILPGLPYLIPYRVKRSDVQILRVLHAARDWPKEF